MDGYKAYKLYAAIKQHFTNPKYDVVAQRGRINYPLDRFLARNDRPLFDKLGRTMPVERDLIEYVASNFMYGNDNVIYDKATAEANWKLYTKRKQSLSYIFRTDLDTIAQASGYPIEDSRSKIPVVIQLLISRKICIETVTIINAAEHTISRLKSKPIGQAIESTIVLVEKAVPFVRPGPTVLQHFARMKEDIEGHAHG